ncbi:MAG: serine/threonine dehydratase [Bdellovibrionaceae bacterium]|nr:serine/threonine dehydratase [Pseudobdellovibrionaceae bacterium]
MIDPKEIISASQRLAPYLNQTPIYTSETLNEESGFSLFFKMENLQKINAFKARGALNTLLKLKEKNELPKKVSAYSSGNHAQAVSWACKILGLKAKIFMPKQTSEYKIEKTKIHGAEVILTETREEAEKKAHSEKAFLLPPFDHPDVIAGQGTAVYEALQEGHYDALITPVGGGGLLSGSFLATQLFPEKKISVFGVEPENANDAYQSYSSGKIVRLPTRPVTQADGVITQSVSPLTFYFLKQTQGILTVSEKEITKAHQKLSRQWKDPIEPTSALPYAAVSQLSLPKRSKILLLVSGGNIKI